MRITTDTPKNNLEMALNLFYVKDKEVWVREYGKNGADISLLNLTREILSYQCPYVESDISDDDLIMMMPEWLFDDVRATEHVIGLLYQAAWVCAELREHLKEFEDKEDTRMKKLFISQPMQGKSKEEILAERKAAICQAKEAVGDEVEIIDSYFENETGKYNFIDTAGMRKKSKVDDNIEKYSVLRATMAIERSDVCLIMIDAQDGVTEQDTKVAGLAHEAGKACIIVVNKWDLVEKDDKTMDRMREDIRRDLSYMTYAPIVFISALTGQRVTRLFELINYVREQSSMRITTGMLNSVLADAQTRVQPPTDKGRRLKIYYMTQVGIRPPHFVVFCNDKKLFHFSYRRYLENQIRSVFGLEGTPIIMSIRQKGEEDA